MFPTSRMRMGNIFGGGNSSGYEPPDMNNGMDLMGMLHQILPIIERSKNDDRNFTREMFDKEHPTNIMQPQNRLQDIGNEALKSQEKRILPPTYNGMDANNFFNLAEKRREFDETSKFKGEGLETKKQDIAADNQLGRDKLDQNKNLGQQKVDISKQRADIYKFKSEHPNIQIIRTKGGNIQIYDPADKTTHDTGIDSGTLSDEDEINLKSGKKLEEQDNQNTHRLAEISARIKGQQDLSKQNNDAKQELQDNKPGFYQGEFFRNPNKTTSDNNPDRKLPPAKDVNLPAETKVPDGRTIVYDKDGKAYHLPKEQVEDAIKQGYFKDKPKAGG